MQDKGRKQGGGKAEVRARAPISYLQFVGLMLKDPLPVPGGPQGSVCHLLPPGVSV